MLSINTSGAQGYCRTGNNILAAAVAFLIGGDPYETAPSIAFSGGGGTGAAATSTITGGSVSGTTITNAGSGYTSAPTVAFSGGGGTGATGTAVLNSSGVVKSLAVTTGGTGYTNGTHNLVFAGGGGSGAVGTATIAGGIVTGLTLTTAGSGYTSAPGISLAGTAGAGDGAFAGAATLGYTIASITSTSGGGTTILFTDNTVYVSPDVRDVVNITMYDHFGGKVEGQIVAGSPTVTLSIGGLNPVDGIDAIATVVSSLGNIKDGSIHDIYLIRQSGVFVMEL